MGMIVSPHRHATAAAPAAPGAPYARAGYTEAFGGGNVSGFTIAYPAVLATDDVAFLHVVLNDANGTTTVNTPAGWTLVAQSSIGGTSAGFHHALFWKRLTGAESGNISPAFSASSGLGTFYHAVITIWRGCITSGTPYELYRYARGTGTNTGMNAVDTTAPDRTFLNFIGRDGTATCAEAQSFAEHYDLGTTGAGAVLHYLPTTTPNGFYENATLSASVRHGCHSLALVPQSTVSSGTVPTNDTFFSLVKLLAGFESSIADESGVARTLTAGGNAVRSTAQSKHGTASALFDGAGDYISAPDSGDWDYATAPFTVELFARMVTKTNSQSFLGHWDNAGGLGNCAWFFYIVGGALTFTCSIGGSQVNLSSAWVPTLNQWYHIVAERDVAGKTRLYIDGTMVASAFTQTAAFVNSTNVLTIGKIGTGATFNAFDYNGYQDEIRISKGIARYATDTSFTVPVAAFPRS